MMIQTGDFNNDGKDDFIVGGARRFPGVLYIQLDNGTFKASHMECFEADKGLLLLGDGKGNYKEVPNNKSGLFINGEVRDIAQIRLASGKDLMLLPLNNDSLRLYQLSDN